jgi:hypothetical protein
MAWLVRLEQGQFPLTPALSPRERGPLAQAVAHRQYSDSSRDGVRNSLESPQVQRFDMDYSYELWQYD